MSPRVGIQDDSELSVSLELNQAFVRNLTAFSEAAGRMLALTEPSRETVQAIAREMLAFAQAVVDISRWLYPPGVALNREEASVAAAAYRECGAETEAEMFALFQKRPHRRPPEKRFAHIKAFEFMLLSESNSLGRAVKMICPCGRLNHKTCERGFKTGILELKRILRVHAPHLVGRYEGLHPNRNKRQA